MPNAMLPRERCDYSAIVDRSPLKLPGNARLVFWTIVNLEVWDIRKPMARLGARAANRPNANSGRAELELARIRHARRRVALLRVVQAPTHSPDARDQCPRLRGLSARRRASAGRRLGIHGPLL